MAKISVIKGFSKLADAEIGVKAQSIVNQMTNNPNFTTPTPSLEDVSTAITAYDNALADMPTGGKEKTALKNEKREALEEILADLAEYVEQNCQDNEAIALSSGFDLAKKPAKIGKLPKPATIEVKDGDNQGEVDIKVSKVVGAKSYVFCYTPDPITDASVWQMMPSSNTKITIEGLESVKKYWFKAAAVGANKELNYTDEVSRVTQ
jgi:hypothetical protein